MGTPSIKIEAYTLTRDACNTRDLIMLTHTKQQYAHTDQNKTNLTSMVENKKHKGKGKKKEGERQPAMYIYIYIYIYT